jgi:hypothetical protein
MKKTIDISRIKKQEVVMIKFVLRFLLITILAGLIQFTGASLWAYQTDITIDLNFEKTDFVYGEPIAVEVVITNISGEDLLISEGFTSRNYCLRMRIIDPSGRSLSLVSKSGQSGVHNEFPDAPPLPVTLYNGRPVRVSGCEVFADGTALISEAQDLREFYDISLPGYYSAQVQVSAAVFNSEICEADDYAWRDLLKSNTVFFHLKSDTAAQVVPNQWKQSWLDGDKNVPDILVQIRSVEGREVENINTDTIKINGVARTSVRVLPPKLKAFFDAGEVINSLGGNIQAGEWYHVIISGQLNSGEYFGADQQIRIVK